MEMTAKKPITVETTVYAPVEKVWQFFTSPEHITKWNFASEDWHSPSAENDLRKGGRFVYRMEAKDGSFGFDFGGTFDTVEPARLLEYTMGDGRRVHVAFEPQGNSTRIVESFEAEQKNPEEIQRAGWQAILDNFRKYTEQ